MSRTCDEARARVYHYLDDEIGWWKRARIRRHLRRCPPCEDGFRFERKLQVKIREDCADEVPPELMDRLRRFISEEAEGSGA